MPLDEATRRFSFLLQGDLRRLTEKHDERETRGEHVKFDSVSRIANIETARGSASSRLYGELLATYAPHDRILRWAWAGRADSASPTHGDVVFREGQSRGVPQLTMSVVGDLDPQDALTLVKLGALVARADGIHQRTVGTDVEYIGLFERSRPVAEPADPPNDRYSVPPPLVEANGKPGSGPPPRAYRSIPPIREVYEPRSGGSRPPGGMSWSNLDRPVTAARAARAQSQPPPPDPLLTPPEAPSIPTAPRMPAAGIPPVAGPVSGTTKKQLREPSRALFLPVANAALAALTKGSKGYLQGLFVLTIDPGQRGLVVQLVVVDVAGILRALDPPHDVIDAAAGMVEADRREGNGSWRKLSARITPKPDGGATLHVDVV